MKKKYHIVTRAARESAAIIEQFCQANGQMLLPIVNLIQSASQVVETVIHELGQQTLEVILMLSAEQVAGARTPGKASGANATGLPRRSRPAPATVQATGVRTGGHCFASGNAASTRAGRP